MNMVTRQQRIMLRVRNLAMRVSLLSGGTQMSTVEESMLLRILII